MRTRVCYFSASFLLLALAQAVWAGTLVPPPSPTSLTVVLNYEQPYSQPSFEALQHRLQSILNEVGLKLEVREGSRLQPHEQFSGLVVFHMKGSCSMKALPVGALSDERGPLAMAYSSDGSILPFGEVECDRVRQSLQRLVGSQDSAMYQKAYGSALGMVMAHEIYHMLARSPIHTHKGVTKASLSAREMLEGELSLPKVARLSMREGLSEER